MSNDKPFLKFFGGDWLGDCQLRMCNLAERGLWIDLLCIMSNCEPYGHLALNGKPMSDADIARILGVDVDTYKGHLYRLIELGIPSKTEEGMIYSRRLVRDYKRFTDGSKYGKKGGGNPIFSDKDNKEEENTEARSQKLDGAIKVTYKGHSISWSEHSQNFEGITDSIVSIWEESHPTKDVYAEIAKARSWIISTGNRKKNYGKFLNNWITSSKDTVKISQSTKSIYDISADEKAKNQREFDERMKGGGK